jgi:hypothetical protein
MIGKDNESRPASTQEPSSLRPNIPITLEELLLYLGYCLLDGPLPPDVPLPTLLENDRIKAVGDRARMWLEEAYRLRHLEITEQEIAASKTRDEKLWRYLETEKNLEKLGIPRHRSAFYYLREHGVEKYKTVEHLVKDMDKAGLDPFEHARKRGQLEMFVLGKPAPLEGYPAFPPPPEGFVKTQMSTSSHAEPPRIPTLLIDEFLKWRIQKKRAKAQARAKKSRQKSNEISN